MHFIDYLLTIVNQLVDMCGWMLCIEGAPYFIGYPSLLAVLDNMPAAVLADALTGH